MACEDYCTVSIDVVKKQENALTACHDVRNRRTNKPLQQTVASRKACRAASTNKNIATLSRPSHPRGRWANGSMYYKNFGNMAKINSHSIRFLSLCYTAWAMQVLSFNTDLLKFLSGCLYQQENSNALTACHDARNRRTNKPIQQTVAFAKGLRVGLPKTNKKIATLSRPATTYEIVGQINQKFIFLLYCGCETRVKSSKQQITMKRKM